MYEQPGSNMIIHTESKSNCFVCGQPGEELYADLTDKLYGASGVWSFKKCAECGLAWLDPAPRESELWKAYLNYFTHVDNHLPLPNSFRPSYRFVKHCYISLKYGYFSEMAQGRFKWLGALMYLVPSRREELDFTVMNLPCVPDGKLLDIGCGNGDMLQWMNSLGWQAEGIDFDHAAVENAKIKGLKVLQGSLEEQEYSHDTFDAIINAHVIEHISDPSKFLSEIYRILKPGGVLSLVTPNIDSLGSAIYKNGWRGLEPPRHLMIHNQTTLARLAQNAGFKRIAITTTNKSAHVILRASHVLRKDEGYARSPQITPIPKLFEAMIRAASGLINKLLPDRGEELFLFCVK